MPAQSGPAVREGGLRAVLAATSVDGRQRIAGLARSRLADIVGHLDLIRKFGVRPATDLSREIGAALDAVAAAGMAGEVNASGWHTPSRQAYPEPALLRACCAVG